jgi:hypothetical protein
MKISFTILGRALGSVRTLALFALVVFIAGCSQSKSPPKSPLVGKWNSVKSVVVEVGKWNSVKDIVVEFNADGTCKLGTGKNVATGKYTVNTNLIEMQFGGPFGATEWQMAFTNDVLYITDHDVVGRVCVTEFKRIN